MKMKARAQMMNIRRKRLINIQSSPATGGDSKAVKIKNLGRDQPFTPCKRLSGESPGRRARTALLILVYEGQQAWGHRWKSWSFRDDHSHRWEVAKKKAGMHRPSFLLLTGPSSAIRLVQPRQARGEPADQRIRQSRQQQEWQTEQGQRQGPHIDVRQPVGTGEDAGRRK